MINAKKYYLTDLTNSELKEKILSMGEPEYRTKQLRSWIYQRFALSFQEMTDLPLTFRQALGKIAQVHSLVMTRRVVGKDGTEKALFTLPDGETIESALMAYSRDNGGQRNTVCVSTQVGCGIGCPFCATGQQGFKRNLTCGEIIDQVLYFAHDLKYQDGAAVEKADKTDSRLANIVFMGMGEPLANYDALWQAIETLNSPDGFGIGARNMTISTSGLVPQIKRLSLENLQVGLAISLHAADNALRDKLVPINKKYPLEVLIPTCKEYFKATGRRVSFEYILFNNINDSIARAQALARLLRHLNCHVNLIPANITAGRTFQPPSVQAILAFEKELLQSHINVTLRQPRGQDIDAGCGQLRSRHTFATPEQ